MQYIFYFYFTSALFLLPSGEVYADPTAANMTLRTVALSGTPAIGIENDVRFQSLGIPVITSAGKTAFVGYVSGDGVDLENDSGIWSEGTGTLKLVAREGQRAAGTPDGVLYSRFDEPALNSSGQIAFFAYLSGPGVDLRSERGFWSGRDTSLSLIFRDGERAEGVSEELYYSRWLSNRSPLTPALNSGPSVFFNYLVQEDGERALTGLWEHVDGNNNLIVRGGDVIPGLPAGTTLSEIQPQFASSAGRTVFEAVISHNPGSVVPTGLWSYSDDAINLVARSGSPAPDTPSGVTFAAFGRPALNSSGELAFVGVLAGPGVNASNAIGIWTDRSGSLRLVIRGGEHAPGTPTWVTFRNMSSPVVNAAGQTAFIAALTGDGLDSTNNTGIWSEGSGSVALIARAGQQAPGTPQGVKFTQLMENPVLNALGQSAFRGQLVGENVDASNDLGIWAQDRRGDLRLIVRTGQQLEVAPGDFRTIGPLGLDFLGDSGNDEGQPSGFNNLGQVAFRARFTNGTQGIFVSNLVAVPEPSSLVMLLGCLALWRFHTRGN